MDLAFNFNKKIGASKSEFIRALCLKSWNPEIEIIGASFGEDVQNMIQGLDGFNKNTSAYSCGDSALMLRLWTTRLSRQQGVYSISGTERLFQRPHTALWDTLKQWGCEIVQNNQGLILKSNGWSSEKSHLFVESSKSSQYLSALVLNSWNLKNDITWDYAHISSPSYLELTLNMLLQTGMQFEREQNKIHVRKQQEPRNTIINIEPDMSTAFTIAAWAAVGGQATLTKFPKKSQQPDFAFIDILKKMGVSLSFNDDLVIKKSSLLVPIEVSLAHTPDLFPVLAILCSLADGVSLLKDIESLKWKESNRIEQLLLFLNALGCKAEYNDKGFTIYGKPTITQQTQPIILDAYHDHRLVMAAQTAKLAGYNIKILNPQAINKTAPELAPYVC